MGFKIILLISIYLLTIGKLQQTSFKFHSKVYKRSYSKIWTKEASKMYDATQIGYKRGLPKDLINSFQRLGIIHLLTPSGIHLACILFFLKKILNKHILTILIGVFLVVLKTVGGFYSIKRICIFFLINKIFKSNRLSFVITFLVDLLIGGYADSPLSFALSFMFWGTIIFSKDSKYLVIINLFICQLISSYFFSSQVNLFSFILNPLITSLFSSFFSLLSFQYWTNFFISLDTLVLILIKVLITSIKWIDSVLYFANTYVGILIFLIVLFPRKKHFFVLVIYLIFNVKTLNSENQKSYNGSYYLKESSLCKSYLGKYGIDKKCYFKHIKKAQKIWAKN